jgi:hypothetical protein
MKAWLLVVLGAFAITAQASGPESGKWNFRVLLDGKPIGQHRFTLRTEGVQRLCAWRQGFDTSARTEGLSAAG